MKVIKKLKVISNQKNQSLKKVTTKTIANHYKSLPITISMRMTKNQLCKNHITFRR